MIARQKGKPDSAGLPVQSTERRWAPKIWLRDLQGGVVVVVFAAMSLVSLLTTFGIVLILGAQSLAFFRIAQINLSSFLMGTDPEPPYFGILALIWGTFVIAAGSAVIALPVGLLTALFLSEYAPRWLRSTLKPSLELLAGIPTVVYGYLGLLLVTPALKAVFEPLGYSVVEYNALSASIVVGVMIIPMVSSLSEDVLTSVPQSLREGAYALGATKFEVSTRIVLPAGFSGVMASFILAISRAVGETMAVVLAAGRQPNLSINPLIPVETMTAYIVAVIQGEESPGSPKSLSLFAVSLTLFVMTLGLNLISSVVIRRFREVYQ